MNLILQYIQMWKMWKIGIENRRIGNEVQDLIKKQGCLTEEQSNYYLQKLASLSLRLDALRSSS